MAFQISVSVKLLSIFLCILIAVPPIQSKKGCSFQHDGCTYNIHLNHGSGTSSSNSELNTGGSPDCGAKQIVQEVNLDRIQNDYTAKIDDIEKNFSFLRDTHEQRIKELESTIDELIGSAKTPYKLEVSDSKPLKETVPQIGVNADLMERLEVEFEKLRDEIRQKSIELMDTKFKLNETSQMMHEAQLKHFKTSQDLVSMENQVTMLRRERAVLKNQLKDRSYKLEISDGKAQECEMKSTDQQNKLMTLFRSESKLKEQLMTTEMDLNVTRKELDGMHSKHQQLRSRHDRVKTVLKIRERELLNCYWAKTSTFCGFEDPDICGFTNINDTSDFFDWTRGQTKTPSSKTGPTFDHTCKSENGHFMYIEASAKGRGSNAILYSPLYRGMTEQCVDFYYHMYGRNVGTLNVYAQARGAVLNSAWRAYGNQGDYWTRARLSIPKELANAGYQLAFEGITENGYRGDMAIDDVSVRDGPCPTDVPVTPVKVKVNSTEVIDSAKKFARKLRRKRRKLQRA